MSALISIADLWDVDVTVGLTTHKKHRHVPSPISPLFQAPGAAAVLTFGPIALAAAVARTATTRQARPQLLVGLQKSALAQLECLISNGPAFELTQDFGDLADTERTLFAARCGAGITDLYMNALGYIWRANAACLSKALNPHADFLYDGGNVCGHGVVLAEAHGSFAANATAKTVAAQASRKYARQVKPYVNAGSPFGHVVHGYPVAFGSKPGTTGAFLSLAETRIPKPKKKSPPAPAAQSPAGGGVSTPIALATHRSNFLLMGASQVVDWIDWIITPGELPAELWAGGFCSVALCWALVSRKRLYDLAGFAPPLVARWVLGRSGLAASRCSQRGRQRFPRRLGWLVRHGGDGLYGVPEQSHRHDPNRRWRSSRAARPA